MSFLRPRARATMGGKRAGLSSGMAFAVLSFGVTAFLALGTSVLTARLYGVTVVGQYALALAPTAALIALSTVREQPALVRKLALLPVHSRRASGLFVAVFTFSAALTVVVGALVAVATYFVYNGPIDHPVVVAPAIAMLAANAVITNTTYNLDTIFAAYRDGRTLFIVRLEESIMFVVLLVAMRYVTKTVWAPSVATALAPAIPMLHRVVRTRRWITLRPGWDAIRKGFGELPPIIRFGLKMTPGSVISGFGPQLGVWMLGATSSISAVGSFSRARNISKRFTDVQWRIGEMLLPALVERRDQHDTEAFQRTLMESLRYALVGLLLPAAVLAGAARPVMSVFGDNFTSAAPALAVSMLNPVIVTANTILGTSLIASNRPGWTSWTTVASFSVNLTSVIVFTHMFGITGAAIGPVLGPLAGGTVAVLVCRRAHRFEIRRYWGLRFAPVTVVACAAGFAAAKAVGDLRPGFTLLPLALMAGSVAYVGAFTALGGLTGRDRDRLRRLWARLRRTTPAPVEPIEQVAA